MPTDVKDRTTKKMPVDQQEKTMGIITSLADLLTYRKQAGPLSEMYEPAFDEDEQQIIKDKIFQLIKKIE